MERIAREQVAARLKAENPWWRTGHVMGRVERWAPRAYLRRFLPLVDSMRANRAVVLMGPRRVGKTVLLHHAIADLLRRGTHPGEVTYISVDHPLYNGLGLEDFVELAQTTAVASPRGVRYLFFDEIQYLRDWEVHLKVLVDSFPDLRIVASGSAAAALRMKSHESGAGRFTNFMLPPLMFFEYVQLLGLTELVGGDAEAELLLPPSMDRLNGAFVDYLNFGGYPELALSEDIRDDPGRFIKSDIIDKVLLRDLPSLYGIGDIQELNYLFTTLAFNTAQEVSLSALSQDSGVQSRTISKYIDYLEAAFLIRVVHGVKRNARRFQRARNFKVYLTNPSMRAALFAPVDIESRYMGALAETAVFSQWFHSGDAALYYARWNQGEVDIVRLNEHQRPTWAVEVKWSDQWMHNLKQIRPLLTFATENDLEAVHVTSRSTYACLRAKNGLMIHALPASLYAYTVGRDILLG